MSPTTKIIVTTIQNDTLGRFVRDNPYWIGHNYGQESTAPDHSKWDIVVMSDGDPPLIYSPYPDSAFVIWLKHRSTTKGHSDLQDAWVAGMFPNCELEPVMFSHGTDNNLSYFNAILALGTHTDDYQERLSQLIQRLLGQDLTERAVTFLYSLALAMELRRLNSSDSVSGDSSIASAKAMDKALSPLKKSLARHGERGTIVRQVVADNLEGFYGHDGCFSVEHFRTIRDSLRELCTS